MTYTIDFIRQMMVKDRRWLERGILAIYRKQTEYEKRVKRSYECNEVGFNAADAPLLSYLARWLLSGKSLSGKWKRLAWQRMPKYAGQLVKVINKEV